MMTFKSSTDLLRLHRTDPAQPVIAKLADGLFTDTIDTDPVTIALLQSCDIDHPLAEMFDAEDVFLEGVIKQEGVYLVALQTEYDYGLVIVVPDAEWLENGLRRCIEQNLYH